MNCQTFSTGLSSGDLGGKGKRVMLSGTSSSLAEDLRKGFVGNTVVAQLPEGTAYAFAEPGGIARGLHPTEGRINGRYEISDDGVICVTWPLTSGEVKNCDKTVPKGDQKSSWAGKTIKVVPGDPKGLGS